MVVRVTASPRLAAVRGASHLAKMAGGTVFRGSSGNSTLDKMGSFFSYLFCCFFFCARPLTRHAAMGYWGFPAHASCRNGILGLSCSRVMPQWYYARNGAFLLTHHTAMGLSCSRIIPQWGFPAHAFSVQLLGESRIFSTEYLGKSCTFSGDMSDVAGARKHVFGYYTFSEQIYQNGTKIIPFQNKSGKRLL